MRIIRLRELDSPASIALAAPLAEALSASGAVRVDYTAEAGLVALSAAGQVGVVRVGDVQLVIEPKVPIRRLVFLLGYARHPNHWRDDGVLLDEHADLPEALAHAFLHHASRALEQGVIKGYREIDDAAPVLRGRIREADQLRQRWGRSLPLELRYDDFTVDIAENRFLLGAALRLLRTPGVPRPARTALQRMRLRLADVTAPIAGQPLPTWSPSRLNARYAPALALAELVLAGRSFEQRTGEVRVTGFLLNMASLFEDFVTTALGAALTPHGGRPSLQHRMHLDVDERVRIRPDFVWLRDGRPCIVADAKYKAESPAGFPQADLYQLLAYCTVLRLPVGHLVYARGNESAAEHVVQGAGTRIVSHALELDAAPAAVLADVGRIAERMLDGARLASRAAC